MGWSSGSEIFGEIITALKEHIDDGFEIYERASGLFLMPLQKPVRLVGISLSGFIKGIDQISLIEHSENSKKALAAMDEINDRFGEFKITRASILHNKLREKCGMAARERQV